MFRKENFHFLTLFIKQISILNFRGGSVDFIFWKSKIFSHFPCKCWTCVFPSTERRCWWFWPRADDLNFQLLQPLPGLSWSPGIFGLLKKSVFFRNFSNKVKIRIILKSWHLRDDFIVEGDEFRLCAIDLDRFDQDLVGGWKCSVL